MEGGDAAELTVMTRRELKRPNKPQHPNEPRFPIAALRIIIAYWHAVGLARIWAKMRAAFNIKRVTVEAMFSFIMVIGRVNVIAHTMDIELRRTLVPVTTGLALITCGNIFRHVRPTGSSHGNPTVTFTAFIFPHHFTGFTRLEAPSYFLGQLIGSFFAWGVMWILLYPQQDIGTTIIKDHSVMHITQAIGYETMATFILILTRISVFSDNTLVPVRDIVLGCAAYFGSLVAWPVSGGSMNPFLSFASSLVGGIYDDWYIYWIGPILGSILAGLIYRAIFSQWDDTKSTGSGVGSIGTAKKDH